ncbi:uncharacterized protein LAJ45_04181 [Morchella importuna]|uniref:Uncharacterized protein n=1 Tax=Morchella conica CCBAS932 TaxID=1392247 RepID=A0A3N4L3G3_9PEZI|nr:uncharacterized protein LAJ45_04181 [Morchella importuna]KAH8151560.1 hypothetical protein LAJ45_04181 [Morchella importuna]RPB15171.1 hypothetical protein P167DRAFT_533364 [Morchella conica CCBAS932]
MPPTQPIHAGSLSTVTKLADNPPLYVNPTAPVMPSLILYIVRVPGSQDLFLTTLHPLSTTVTAEDINACIYYIHIHPNSTGTDTATPPQPSHLAPRPTHHRRWSSQSLRSPRWHKTIGTLPTMTIVRRDPASGAQWNVAKVSQLPPVPDNDDASNNDRIMLEITAEGYDKFLPPAKPPFHPPPSTQGVSSEGPDLTWQDFAYRTEAEEREAWEARRRGQLRRESSQFGMNDWMIDDDQPLEEVDRVFRRVMSLEGVGFWKRVKGIGHHRKSKSHDGNGSNGSSGDGEKAGPRKEKAKKRGYVFQGLWGAGADGGLGRCGFKDEAAGKFLKCKYYPPDINSTAQRSSLLSVIEFKPPSTTVMSSSSSGRHRTPSPSTDINSAAPESITSVKSKLGMLVLHSDGQYMMDLLVAANMAVFWRRWESWAAERSALGAR